MTSLVLLTACCLFGADDPKPAALYVGDPAPPLTLQSFVKGEPVEKFEEGKTYVVEFWATWCGPCKRSIPHISELQAKYEDVIFIGVDVMEDDADAVKEFVEQMGKKMDYRVAIDAPGEGPARGDDPPPGQMASAWLEAGFQSGIPAAFVVNGEGQVAWIGHPMEMDDALAAIVGGKWDLKQAAEEFRQKVGPAQLERALNKAFADGDPTALREAIEAAVAVEPAKEKELGVVKLITLLAPEGEMAQAEAYAEHLLAEPMQGDWMAMLGLANFIASAGGDSGASFPEALRPRPASAKLKTLALKTAEEAVELASKEEQPAEAAAQDALAGIYSKLGQAKRAVETQEAAIGKAKGTQLEGDAGMLERLRKYRKATKQGTEKSGTEKPGTEKPGTEKPGTEKPGTGKPTTEKPAAEKPAAEKPSKEKPSKGKL